MAKAKTRKNLFDIKHNKKKFDIIGRVVKGAKGNPGVSRIKATDTRVETLLKEFHNRKSTSQFIDKRIGEKNKNLDEEEKIHQRFTKEKQRKLKNSKKGMFNLEETHLTHHGTLIDNIEDFSENEDDETNDTIDQQTVQFTHFGGFEDSVDPSKPKTKQQVMREVVAKSKYFKQQRQVINDENEDLCFALDEGFSSLRKLLSYRTDDDVKPVREPSKFDADVYELADERRARATDRLKTEHELIFEENNRLEKLERHRLRRMNGEDSDTDNESKHYAQSGDSLKLDYALDGDDNNEESEDGEDGDEGDEGESEDGESKDDESDESDDYEAELDENRQVDVDECVESTDGTFKVETANPKPIDPKDKIPFTPKLPMDSDSLKELIADFTFDEVKILYERIEKCNHIKLDNSYKELWAEFSTTLIDIILYYFNTNAIFAEYFYQKLILLLPLYGNSIATHFAAKLKQVRKSISKGVKEYPIEFLALSRLICAIYSTSDFRHYIVTPWLILLNYYLESVNPKSESQTARGLYLCNIYISSQSISKRHSPEVFNFLLSYLSTFSNADTRYNFPKRTFGTETIDGTDNFSFLIKGNDLKQTASELLLKYFKLLSETKCAPELFSQAILVLNKSVTNEMQTKIDQILANREPLQLLKAKPKALPMYTPQYDMAYSMDRKRDSSNPDSEIKKLKALVKKEQKGAVRELKRDSQFLAREKEKIRKEKDSKYKKTINSIHNILDTDQNEMKKLSKK